MGSLIKITRIRLWLLRRAIQLFTSLEIIIDRFFKSGPQFGDGFAVKTNDIIDICNMPDKTAIDVAVFNSSNISFIDHKSSFWLLPPH